MEKLLASLSQTKLSLERGQEVEGKVILVTDKEIIVDLGTKSEGVIQTRDLPQDLKDIKSGQTIKAYVSEGENEYGQIMLSVQLPGKQTASTPKGNQQDWSKLAQKYPVEETVKGIVTKITQFGVFVKLEEGVEGLIHVSKLGPDDNFEAGQEVTVTIDSVDPEKRRISLVPVITSTKGLIYK